MICKECKTTMSYTTEFINEKILITWYCDNLNCENKTHETYVKEKSKGD